MKPLLIVLSLAVLSGAGLYWLMINMPGRSYSGPPPELDAKQLAAAKRLEHSVTVLARDIGERSVRFPKNLSHSAEWIATEFSAAGLSVSRQSYPVDLSEVGASGVPCENVIAEKVGAELPEEILVVGAHYDSLIDTVGANDNASGVAAVIELARRFAGLETSRSLRFVAFANEEPPFFLTEQMGSLVYAKELHRNDENIIGMISVETIGFFTEERNSQRYPRPFAALYPDRGNFIGIVSDLGSRRFLRKTVQHFRRAARIPSQAGAIPSFIPGVGASDQWAFWQAGYPALMVTDTAPYRYPHYHRTSDTPDKLNYERMALVVDGLESAILRLANDKP